MEGWGKIPTFVAAMGPTTPQPTPIMREKRYNDRAAELRQRILKKGYQCTLHFVDDINYLEVTICGRATAGYGKEFGNLRDGLNYINLHG